MSDKCLFVPFFNPLHGEAMTAGIKWYETEKGKTLIKSAFDDAGMPEVTKDQLEVGTYTNADLAAFFNDPMEFLMMTMKVSKSGDSPVSKRSVMSFAVEMLPRIED